jgi:DNA polymerase I-like protein with 3'-5' exonuclease and polymerase domains
MSTKKQEGYWEPEEELQITLKLRYVLTDKNTRCIFHNGHFDTQVYATEWGYVPNVYADTMLMQHVAFPELRKSLDFVSSFFASYYRFWKEDGKYWDPSIHDEDQFWIYNCDDCCYTYECYEELDKCIDKMELRKPLEIKMATYMPLLEMMLRGVAIDQNLKARIGGDLAALMRERMIWFEGALGHPLNPLSNHPNGQMRKLLYEDLRVPPEMDRKTRRATLNDAAIDKIKHKFPVLRPLLEKVQEYRSLNVFKSTFADAKLSPDGRIRCSFNSAKVVTYRLSSSKNIWGEGANLQTIPKGTEEKGDKKDVDTTEILSDLRKPINDTDS